MSIIIIMDNVKLSLILTQFSMINLGRSGNLRHMFTLYNKVDVSMSESILGHNITLGPASRRISATCTVIAIRTAVEV